MPLGEAEALAFRPGDSLSLAPSVVDPLGNAAPEAFLPLVPPAAGSLLPMGIRFRENPARARALGYSVKEHVSTEAAMHLVVGRAVR